MHDGKWRKHGLEISSGESETCSPSRPLPSHAEKYQTRLIERRGGGDDQASTFRCGVGRLLGELMAR